MLAIRMQRVGRSGHAQFRMIVQDSRFHPSSGRVVAYLGSYNPHTKAASFDTKKIEAYLANGAQPSERVVKLLQSQKMELPKWVSKPVKKTKPVRNPDKRRGTRPEEPAEPEATAPTDEAPAIEDQPTNTEAVLAEEQEKAEAPAEKPAEEAPAKPETEPAQQEQPSEDTKDQKPAH